MREGEGRKELWLSFLKLWNFHNFHSLSVLKTSIYFCHLPNIQYLFDYISVWLLERLSDRVTTSIASFKRRCNPSGLHLRPLGLRVLHKSQNSRHPETKNNFPKGGTHPSSLVEIESTVKTNDPSGQVRLCTLIPSRFQEEN